MFSSDFINQLRSKAGFITGTGVSINLWTLLAIYSLSVVTSLPGLAVSPILGTLSTIFPTASQVEIQMLESLPALIIIPFILLSGKLSVGLDMRKIVMGGLGLFVLSTFLYFIPIGGIGFLLLNSVILGIGAGVIIPLSTGLISHYFAGRRRTQQLGIVSAVSNLSLVLATALAGYLAGIEWRLSFAVYALSIVSLTLSNKLKKTTPNKIEMASLELNLQYPKKAYLGGRLKSDYPFSLMIFYFVITISILSVPMNLSIFMQSYDIGSAGVSGTLIAIFFLSITIPGFFINKLISAAKERNNLIWLGSIILGSIIILTHTLVGTIIGIVFMGFGYGVMQPLIYDRTSEQAVAQRTTFHLALVMTMNYLAIIVYPFVQSFVELVIVSKSSLIPFLMTIVFTIGYWVYDFGKVRRALKSKP